MKHDIIMAGFGGQGIMVMGQLLTYAGLLEGKHVSWMPSYGPEMRGGTANCSVVIADGPIGEPTVHEPTAAVIMNLPSLDKFEQTLKPGGALIVNSSLVDKRVKRDDVDTYYVPINQIAAELDNVKMINMVALGALLAAAEITDKAAVMKAFSKKYASKPAIVKANETAFDRGFAFVAQST